MRNVLVKLLKNKFAVIGLTVILLLIVVALFAPVISPYTPSEQNVFERLQAPSLTHFFGTDDLGRDVFTRMIFGA
ncbi:MAG: D,D-dipeptide ABC transporter permease, partial [Elusimicrobia bacterium]|nr:D,D-dipeptide ABC transporter permease [Elusimicrobiota bacterium]